MSESLVSAFPDLNLLLVDRAHRLFFVPKTVRLLTIIRGARVLLRSRTLFKSIC